MRKISLLISIILITLSCSDNSIKNKTLDEDIQEYTETLHNKVNLEIGSVQKIYEYYYKNLNDIVISNIPDDDKLERIFELKKFDVRTRVCRSVGYLNDKEFLDNITNRLEIIYYTHEVFIIDNTRYVDIYEFINNNREYLNIEVYQNWDGINIIGDTLIIRLIEKNNRYIISEKDLLLLKNKVKKPSV